MPEFQKWWVAIKWTFQKVLFVTVFFPSYYWNKFACIFHSYLCYFLFLYFVRYCFFYFKILIQISFLIFIAKLMLIINSLLLSNYLIKMSQFSSFHYAFPFFCYIFILQLIFFGKYVLLRLEKNFFHGHWEANYFFHGEERYKMWP